MATDIDMDALRLEVMKRHNLLLGPNDPIFAAITLNELVLSAFLDRAGQASENWERRGAALMAQEVVSVKTAAEKMILGAAAFFAAEVKKAVGGAENALGSAIDARINAAVAAAARAEAARRPAVWAAAVSVAASLLTLGVALGAHMR